MMKEPCDVKLETPLCLLHWRLDDPDHPSAIPYDGPPITVGTEMFNRIMFVNLIRLSGYGDPAGRN